LELSVSLGPKGFRDLMLGRHPFAQIDAAVTEPRIPSRLVLLLPIIFFELYLLGSLLGFVYAPVDAIRVANPWNVVTFALLGQLAILVGYLVGFRRPSAGFSRRVPVSVVAKLTIVVSTIVFASALIWRANRDVSLWTALTHPGVAYMARYYAMHDRTSTPMLSIVRGVLGPCLGMFLPIGMLYLKRLSIWWKSLWVLGLGLYLLDALSTGAAKGIFDIDLTLPWVLLIGWLGMSASLAINRGKAKAVRLAFDVALVVVMTMFSLQYFWTSRQSRYEPKAPQSAPVVKTPAPNPQAKPMPVALQHRLPMVIWYWSGGYKGLAECLKLPYQPCFGVGHSYVLSQYAGKLGFGDSLTVFKRSYPARAEVVSGYSANSSFHTIYPWLASDLTFPGALLFMGLMGFLLALSWSDSLRGENPFAAGFLCQALLMFYYVPCNNIRLGFSEELIAFWGLLVLWFVTRKRTAKHELDGLSASLATPVFPRSVRSRATSTTASAIEMSAP
jgi:hypothetical protein